MQGGSLIFLNSPEKLEFGINYHQWEIGPKFKGMKHIPEGTSLIQYSLGLTKSTILKHIANNIFVFKYDAETEEFKEELDPDQLNRILLNYHEFEPFLGAYPQNKESERWQFNSKYLKPEVVMKIVHSGFITTNSVSRFSNE